MQPAILLLSFDTPKPYLPIIERNLIYSNNDKSQAIEGGGMN